MPFPLEPPKRGEIYWVDWSPGRGSEQSGRRPGLVISPDHRNRAMPTVVMAAMTTRVRPEVRAGQSRVCVFLPAGLPMTEEGAVLGFQVMTVSKERLENFGGTLSAQQIHAVNSAIRTSFGL